MLFPTASFVRKCCHYCAIILFFISLLSGIRLAFDNPYMPAALLHLPLIPEGNVLWWHEVSACGWLVLIVYGLWRYYSVHSTKPPYRKLTSRLITWTYWLVLVQCFTGLISYAYQFMGNHSTDKALFLQLHFISAGIFLMVVVLHLCDQFIIKPWRAVLQIFWPKHITASAVFTVVIGLSAGLLLYRINANSHLQLVAKKIAIDQEIVIDGQFNESSWQLAQPTRITTFQGNNTYLSNTTVEVRMLHNGLSAYFAIRWPDKTPSYRHLPLVKTASGWRVLHNGFEKDDERTFYEDKLAVMLSRSGGLGGGYSVHLGKQPLSGHPASRSQRGYHYTTDNTLRDVWHWKAVRVDDMSFLDDNHFAAPSPPCDACPRYLAGYRYDPKDSGAFRANWTWFYPHGVVPLRLPMHPIYTQQNSNEQSDAINLKENHLSWFDTVPYDKSLDDYPIGSELPSVLTFEGFEGDRADVEAEGRWHNGYWHLELARNIKVTSQYDLPLDNGIYLWFSPFDHAQSRHSYHLSGLQLVMEGEQ